MTRMATGWCAVAVTLMGPRLWWGGSRVMTLVPAVAKEAAKIVWRLEDNKRKLFCFGAVAWSRVGPREGATSFRRSQQRPKSRQHRKGDVCKTHEFWSLRGGGGC